MSSIKFEELSMRNYILCIDQSGSMGEPVGRGNRTSRWSYAKESAVALARKLDTLDADGIDVFTFNKTFQKFSNVTADKVNEVFTKTSPMGGTDFVPVITAALDLHFSGNKPTTIIVLTDGEPSNGQEGQRALAKTLIGAANKIEGDAELAIQFIQVGDDPGATAFLKKLDDELQSAGAKFDIVDSKTVDDLENMSMEDVLLAAVND
jgi:hypothetical protein